MPRVLMIDDDNDLLNVTQHLLTEQGFDTAVCSDWSAATKMIGAFNPNVILLDVFLNHNDGLQICNRLKNSRYTRDIPVLILSGFTKLADSAINEFGADDFVAKPFKLSEIISKMKRVLSYKLPSVK